MDAIRGMKFLRDNKDKYGLEVNTNADGLISLALVRDNADDTFTKVFDLKMSDIFAQCCPARIIERLSHDIADKCDLIQIIKADSHEAAPDIDTTNAIDTPDKIPF